MTNSKGYREHKNKFRVDISVNGQRYTEVVNDEASAIARVASIKQQALDGREAVRRRAVESITLKQAFWNCYNDPENDWKDTTHGQKQKYYANKMIEFFGSNKLLKDITKDNWYQFIAQFPDTATNNRRASCFNKIYKHAFSQGNVTKVVYIPRKKERLTRLATFSIEDEQAIYKACDQLGYNDLKDLVTCLIDTGCRAEELLSVTPADIVKHKSDWTLTITRTKTDTISQVGVSPRVKQILLRRLNQPKIFMTSYKKMYRKWNDIRLILKQEDNENFVFHVCRHTCASRLASTGANFIQVCGWMGWSPSSPVAKRYLHFFPRDVINMANKLGTYGAEDKPELSLVSGKNSA